MAKSRSLCFIFSFTISGDSASYFLQMVVIISLEVTQTRMVVYMGTLPSKGPIRDQYIFLLTKFQLFDRLCMQLGHRN